MEGNKTRCTQKCTTLGGGELLEGKEAVKKGVVEERPEGKERTLAVTLTTRKSEALKKEMEENKTC